MVNQCHQFSLTSEPYVNLPKEGDSNWNKNKGYADSRWENMVSFINKNGNKIGFGIGKNLKAPKKQNSELLILVVVLMKKEISNVFKDPGQFVIIKV